MFLAEHEPGTNLIEILKLFRNRFISTLHDTVPLKPHYSERREALFKKLIPEDEENLFPYTHLNRTKIVNEGQVSNKTGKCKDAKCYSNNKYSEYCCIKCCQSIESTIRKLDKIIKGQKKSVRGLKKTIQDQKKEQRKYNENNSINQNKLLNLSL